MSIWCLLGLSTSPCLLLQGIAAVGWQSFRPHICSQCGKRFVSLNGLRLHEDLHKGRYRYKCSYCGKGFSGSTNLRGHLVTHTGVKEFRCKLCEREFRYARQLRRHVEVQHAVAMPSNVAWTIVLDAAFRTHKHCWLQHKDVCLMSARQPTNLHMILC